MISLESEATRLKRIAENKARRELCANGCGNKRRHGSAYCQPCSDKYKKKQV